MSNETKYEYLATDDTVDVGKEPLPKESAELLEIANKYKEMDIMKVYAK